MSSAASPDLSPVSATSALLTPNDLSPAKTFGPKLGASLDYAAAYQGHSNGLLFETGLPSRYHELSSGNDASAFQYNQLQSDLNPFPVFEPFSERPSTAPISQGFPQRPQTSYRSDNTSQLSWGSQCFRSSSDWHRIEEKLAIDHTAGALEDPTPRSYSQSHGGHEASPVCRSLLHGLRSIKLSQPINFLSLLHPSSAPPYPLFVSRIIKASDQQASIFLQQKLKVADSEERAKIVDAICARGFEMMAHR